MEMPAEDVVLAVAFRFDPGEWRTPVAPPIDPRTNQPHYDTRQTRMDLLNAIQADHRRYSNRIDRRLRGALLRRFKEDER